MIRDGRYGVGAALALGPVVGAAQLVRSVGLWASGSLPRAALRRDHAAAQRRAAMRALLIVCALGVLTALPWYVYLQERYSSSVFGRGAPAGPGSCPGSCPGARPLRHPSGSSPPDRRRSRPRGSGSTSIRACRR